MSTTFRGVALIRVEALRKALTSMWIPKAAALI